MKRHAFVGAAIAALLCFSLVGSFAQQSRQAAVVHVDTTPGHAINSFDPDKALGSSIDALSTSRIDQVFTPHILQESLSAGWGPITYRNNAELRFGALHWNPNGAWSDAANQRGYFTGSTDLGEPIRYALSYPLPHRGFATSGDRPVPGPTTYWKSNPYLSSKFTGDSDASLPQWLVVDLRSKRLVSAVRIEWVNPYATTYRVEYWLGDGDALDFDEGPQGEWKSTPASRVSGAKGGTAIIKISDTPVSTRFIRVLMTASSNTCNEFGSGDLRNCVGYAMQSIAAGSVNADGAFVDVSAGATGRQAPSYCASSVDPWHDAKDVVKTGSAHTGFDLLFTSGITNSLPAMVPVSMLYGTPDDAAAQIAYIKKRGYSLAYVEMGEEPDGKHATPEDYGALYIQFANAIHKLVPEAKLGGPIFEGVNEDITLWPDAQGRTSWMGRFVDYLKSHGHLNDLSFVSFEHYPYGRCSITWKSLYEEPKLMKGILDVWWKDGVPKDVPLMVTESHLAAGLTGPMTTVFGGLWLADSVASFLEGGGAVYYHSPIQPQGVQSTCLGWASWSNFVSDENYTIKGYTSAYWAAHMINLEWVAHRSGVHQMAPASADIKDPEGNLLVTAYAVARPDGNWSLLLVNRDETNPHTVKVVFEDSQAKRSSYFAGPVRLVTWGSEQYVWHNDGPNSHPDPDHPPVGMTVDGGAQATYTLPQASVTVLRGRLGRAAR